MSSFTFGLCRHVCIESALSRENLILNVLRISVRPDKKDRVSRMPG